MTTWWDRWIWPAGGSGGIPGDIVATLVWVVIAGLASALLYPPLRAWIRTTIERHFAKQEEMHRLMRHIVKWHPDIPTDLNTPHPDDPAPADTPSEAG
jgi:hypothetical protein